MSERAPLEGPIKALRAIAEAVGLDPDKHRVFAIDVHADVHNLPTIAVKLTEVIRLYRMVEQDAGDEDDDAAGCGARPKQPRNPSQGFSFGTVMMGGPLTAEPFRPKAKTLVHPEIKGPAGVKIGETVFPHELLKRAFLASVTTPLRLFCDGSVNPPKYYGDPLAIDRDAAVRHVEAGFIDGSSVGSLYEIRNHPAIDAVEQWKATLDPMLHQPIVSREEIRAIEIALTKLVRQCDERLFFAFDPLPKFKVDAAGPAMFNPKSLDEIIADCADQPPPVDPEPRKVNFREFT